MKKKIRKIAAIVVAVCSLICCAAVTGSAEENDQYVFYYDNDVEVHVPIDEELSYAEHKELADITAGVYKDDGEPTRYPPQCLEEGHVYYTTQTSDTVHLVRPVSPRCDLRYYNVTKCRRSGCQYYNKVLTGSDPIETCHG